MRPRDTDADALEAQRAIYRRMTPAERVERMAEMCDELKVVALAGIRARHPAYSDADADAAYLRLTLGDDLFRRAFPTRPVLPP